MKPCENAFTNVIVITYSNLTNDVGFQFFFIRMKIFEDLYPVNKKLQIVLLSDMNNLH
jgi:hypothetical protein